MTDREKRYQSSSDFRKALEDRLKNISANQNIPLDRLRRQTAFDRLLARLFYRKKSPPPWLLKGGYALEMRYQNIARTTKDVDFTIPSLKDPQPEKIHEMLQKEVKYDLKDWFTFFIGTARKELGQAVYGGWEFPVEARLDNREFTRFHLDVGVGDAVVGKPEWQKGQDLLHFAEIEPAYAALLPKAQQFAEKIHSYTYPQELRPFSRPKDLVDIVLLIDQGMSGKKEMQQSIKATFDRRRTHPLPAELPVPVAVIAGSYNAMAIDCGVSRKTIDEAYSYISGYWKKLF